MDKETALEALFARAFRARKPIYKLCREAGVAPSTITRWKGNPETMRASTLARLEARLAEIEAERTNAA